MKIKIKEELEKNNKTSTNSYVNQAFLNRYFKDTAL